MATNRDCSRYSEWASSPVGTGELTASLRAHLESCEECRADRESAGVDLERVDRLMSERLPIPEPADLTDRILDALPTPAWRLRQARTWGLPAVALAALSLGSLALLRPLPELLSEGWAPLALLDSPLAAIGESIALLGRGAKALARSGLVGGPSSIASAAALGAAIVIGAVIVRFGGWSSRRAWERRRS